MAQLPDFGNLSTYSDQMSLELISKAVLTTSLMDHITLRSGLRAGQVTINLLDADLNVSDRSCGWPTTENQGQLQYSQVTIDMAEKQTKTSFCPTDVRDYYLSERLSASAHAEEVPFEEVVTNLFVEKIRNYNETFIGGEILTQVQAEGSGAANTNQDAASDVNTIIGDVLDLFDAIDESVKHRDDLIVVMSPSNFGLLRRALTANVAYSYNYNQGEGREGELIIPGANIKAVRSSALINDPAMVAGPSKDAIVGVGLEDDFDMLKVFYSADFDEVRMMAAWRLGVGVSDTSKWAHNGL